MQYYHEYFDADNSICVGDITSLVFSVSTTGSSTGDTFQWRTNGANIAGAHAQKWQYIPQAGDFADGESITISVTTAGGFGCTYISASGITMDLNTDPVATLANNTGGTDTICSGNSVQFIASPSLSGATFEFFLDGSPVSDGVIGNIYTVPSNTITGQVSVSVRVTKDNCSDTVTKTIFVPTITSGGSIGTITDATLCPGITVGDISSVSAAVTQTSNGSLGGVLTYQWQSLTNDAIGWQDVTGATAVALDVSSTPLNGNINNTKIRRLATNTLNGVACSFSSEIRTVSVDTNRNPVITVSPGTTVCSEDVSALIFTLSTTGSTTGDTFQWIKNGANIVGADFRCTNNGTSSLFAFVKVAQAEMVLVSTRLMLR